MFSFKSFSASASARQCLSYVSSCFDSLKTSIKNCQVYATGYDERSTRYYTTDAQYDPHHVPPRITQEMEVLMNSYVPRRKRLEIMAKDLSTGIAQSFVYGAFVVYNFIVKEKKSMVNYLFQMGGNESQAKANVNDIGIDLSAAVLLCGSTWYPASFADAVKETVKSKDSKSLCKTNAGDVGADLSAGANLSAGTDLSAGTNLSAGADLSAGVLHHKSTWYPAAFADAMKNTVHMKDTIHLKDGTSLHTEDIDDMVLVQKPKVPTFDEGWAFVDKDLSFSNKPPKNHRKFKKAIKSIFNKC